MGDLTDADPLVVAAFLGEEGSVAGMMRAKPRPTPFVSGTAIVAGAKAGHERVCECLLRSKADVNSDFAGESLSIFFKQHGNMAVIPVYVRNGLNPNGSYAGRIFEKCADQGEAHGENAVKILLQYKLDPHSEYGYKGLQLSSQSGHTACVKLLLEARSDPMHPMGLQSLQTAVLMGQFKVVNMLLKASADASSRQGNEALNCAVHIGNNSLVKLLLTSHADPSSGLPAAAFRGNFNFVQMLIEQKADARSRQKAMKEAARCGHQMILENLMATGLNPGSSAADSALRLAQSRLKLETLNNQGNSTGREFNGIKGIINLLESRGVQRQLALRDPSQAAGAVTWTTFDGRRESCKPPNGPTPTPSHLHEWDFTAVKFKPCQTSFGSDGLPALPPTLPGHMGITSKLIRDAQSGGRPMLSHSKTHDMFKEFTSSVGSRPSSPQRTADSGPRFRARSSPAQKR